MTAPAPGEFVVITCQDDGCGMSNLHDIRTVFYTSKTDSHLQRGRMGRGFKELLCLAQSATVVSGQRVIEFRVESGRRISRQRELETERVSGMRVTMQLPWAAARVAELEKYFQLLLPPSNVQLIVNGVRIGSRQAVHRVKASLSTEVFEEGRWMRPAARPRSSC